MTKRIISVVVSVCLVLLLLPLETMTASAKTEYTNGYYTFMVHEGEAVITDVHNSISGIVNIPTSLAPRPDCTITRIASSAFEGCNKITKITIPNGITSIGDHAFANCTSLADIEIPKSVVSIEYSAFYNTEYYNNHLNWDANVLYIDDCCIEAEDTLSGNYNVKKNTRIIADLAFRDCTFVTSINIPNSVENIGIETFWGCTSLKNVHLSNSVTSITDCMFWSCSSLIEIEIPDSVTSIDDYAFNRCTSLTTVVIPKQVSNIAYTAFSDCSNLSCIDVFEDNLWFSSVDGVLFNKKQTELVRYPEGKEGVSYAVPKGVSTLGQYAFFNCLTLKKIIIPVSVSIIDDSVNGSSFRNCSNLGAVWYEGTPEEKDIIKGSISTYSSNIIHWFYNRCIMSDTDVHIFNNDCDGTCDCGYERITVHSYQPTYNSENHYEECTVCGNKNNFTSHIFDTSCDTTCNGCDYIRSIVHNYQPSHDNESHYEKCTECDNKINVASHTFENNCDTFCDDCAYTRSVTHEYQPNHDSENHYEECTICGTKVNISVHTYENACDMTCECGYIRTTTHEYEILHDSETHYEKCAECGDVINVTFHTFDNKCDKTCNECAYIRSIAHDYQPTYNSESHYEECTVCSDEKDIEKHKYDNACDTDCNVCGTERTITHAYKTAWTQGEESHWHECSACGDKKDIEKHKYDNACDTDCNVCEKETIITHAYKTEWTWDEGSHWHECIVCEDKVDIEKHTYDNACDTICNVCDYEKEHVQPDKLEIVQMPTKSEYRLGEEYSLEGLILKATYFDGTTEIITSEYQINGMDSVEEGIQIISVVYNGVHVDINLIVHDYKTEWSSDKENHWHECKICGDKIDIEQHTYDNACDTSCNICEQEREHVKPDKLEIVQMPTKLEYRMGEEYSLEGLVLKATYFDGTTEFVTSEHQIDGMDSVEEGIQIISVVYYGAHTDIDLIVHDYKTEWNVDKVIHWHECKICGDKEALEQHVFKNWEVAVVATTTSQGLEKRICTVCGYEETRAIAKLPIGTWKHDGMGWWYQNPNGTYPANCWKQIDNVWYYFNASGYIVTGWRLIGGTWYYFNGSGAMVTGWKLLGGTWYYFTGGGAMVTGWQSIGGVWYYFEGSGAMVANRWVGNYYLQADGSMATNKWIGIYYVGADGVWIP